MDMIYDDATPRAEDGDAYGPECVTFTVRMPSELYRGLMRTARENGLSRAAVLRVLVRRMLDG